MGRNGCASLRQKSKQREVLAKEEERIQEAIEVLRKSGTRQTPHNTYYGLSVTSVAAQFGIDHQKLRRRLQGVPNRSAGQEQQMKLKPVQEVVLGRWIKELGHRSIPWTPQMIREKASLIAGCYVSEGWVYRYAIRNPDLKSRLTVGLESCRARALNQTTTTHYFEVLQDTIAQYNIKPEDIYNMDEKGVQMGLGARTRVLVDRNQKTIYMKTDGNRELVTLVECVCADGTALSPLAIFKGKRTNPRWAFGNCINASIAASPNGWTDAELGSLWLELIFEPQTRTKLLNPSEYRLLILDGHGSHCTLKFLSLAEEYKIIILCLPPHTTHVLQPCDVGVFGPLSSRYKKEVTKLSKLNIPIRKENLLQVYGKARVASFTPTTIKSAFRKTGIHPLNAKVLPTRVFEPALNTTTQSAQPMPASSPSFINAIPIQMAPAAPSDIPILPTSVPSNATNNLETHSSWPEYESSTTDIGPSLAHMDSEDDQPEPRFRLILPEMPSVLPSRASRMELIAQIKHLRKLLDCACTQIAADHAQKILMDQENGQLRMQLFYKSKEKDSSRVLTSSARVLTHQDTQILYQVQRYLERMKLVHDDLQKAVTARAKRIEANEKEMERATREAQQTEGRRRKEADRRQKDAEKEAERQRKMIEREALRKRKEAEREMEQARKAAEKVRKAIERQELIEQRAKTKGTRGRRPKQNLVALSTASEANLQSEKENTHPHPPAPLLLPSSIAFAPSLQSAPTTISSPLQSHSSTLRGQQESQIVEVGHGSPARPVFGLHNVDPQLLGQ